jgi:hypothetical protein
MKALDKNSRPLFRLQVTVSIILLSGILALRAQTIQKVRGKVGGRPYSYHRMQPAQPVRGMVVLMPSRGEEPKKVFGRTAIPRHLARRGFLVIVPRLNYALILEDASKNILNQITSEESARTSIPASQIFVGGFSSGGAIAAHYAEYLVSEKGNTSVKGVFLIDPPLDLARLYKAWVGLSTSSCPRVITSESTFIKSYVERITGGTPDEKPESYLKLSAFSATDSAGGNARFLKDVPVRLYTEPDVETMQKKYCQELSYQNLNSTDLDALHACLTKLGNPNAEYIRTEGRGLHSWNLVDAEDFVRWVEGIAGLNDP